jgi:hypothetical protein
VGSGEKDHQEKGEMKNPPGEIDQGASLGQPFQTGKKRKNEKGLEEADDRSPGGIALGFGPLGLPAQSDDTEKTEGHGHQKKGQANGEERTAGKNEDISHAWPP